MVTPDNFTGSMADHNDGLSPQTGITVPKAFLSTLGGGGQITKTIDNNVFVATLRGIASEALEGR